MRKGLVIIDVQNDYFPGGAMELSGMTEAAENCRKLLQRFRAARAAVVHVQHYSVQPGANFFVPETPGCAIHDSVRPTASEAVIPKLYPNAFRGTWLADALCRCCVAELVVCGAMTHTCIDFDRAGGVRPRLCQHGGIRCLRHARPGMGWRDRQGVGGSGRVPGGLADAVCAGARDERCAGLIAATATARKMQFRNGSGRGTRTPDPRIMIPVL